MPLSIRNTRAAMQLEEKEVAKQNKNLEKYGARNWYDWSNKNWGTKWDAYSCNKEIEYIDYGIRYKFDTASGPPTQWLSKTSELFPDLEFSNYWNNEGGSAGHDTFQNGAKLCRELSQHEWWINFDEDYADEYNIIHGNYEKMCEHFLKTNECDYRLEKYLLEKIKDEDLPLFINFNWELKDDFEKRFKRFD